MDLRQLRHFDAIARTLHFGRAAQRLGMTQPPLSQSIQALERELGAALFVRSRRSVALTPFGEEWLKSVRAALEQFDALPDLARRLRDGAAGHLDLSFVSTAAYSILPSLVQRFASLVPEVEIRLTEATSDVQIADLLDGRGHVGIIIPPTGELPAALRFHSLGAERLVAAVPEAWVASGRLRVSRRKLPAASVIEAPLILFPRTIAPAFHDLVSGYYAAHGGRPRVVQQAIQMQTIVSLVSAGMGIALVPASLRNLARTGVLYVDLAEGAPALETGLAWRRDDASPTLLRFLQTAREAAIAEPAERRRLPGSL